MQCSPYKMVTCKIYRLKQHFLPPVTIWKKVDFKKGGCDPIRFSQGKWIKYIFMGYAFWKENIEDRGK